MTETSILFEKLVRMLGNKFYKKIQGNKKNKKTNKKEMENDWPTGRHKKCFVLLC